MHWGIARNTGLVMALLTVHDSILREALLARDASRRTTALEVAASLRCLKCEIKVPSQLSH